jgi:tetratricopeptide (TPR) repeat protein
VAVSLSALGLLYLEQGDVARAEVHLRRALAVFEKALGADHPDVAACLCAMGRACREQARLAEAESCCKRAMAIYEAHGQAESHGMADALEGYISILKLTGREEEARKLGSRAEAIRTRPSKRPRFG